MSTVTQLTAHEQTAACLRPAAVGGRAAQYSPVAPLLASSGFWSPASIARDATGRQHKAAASSIGATWSSSRRVRHDMLVWHDMLVPKWILMGWRENRNCAQDGRRRMF